MDDFEKAVLVTFNFTGGVDPSLKAQAEAYLNDLKKSGPWRLCLERFSPSSYQEVKFWCLQTLHEIVRTSYPALGAQEKLTVRGTILGWVQQDCTNTQAPVPPFLRNKVAQVLVAVLQHEYPDHWPNFFQELISMAQQGGGGVVDMLCRVLLSVDEDLVSLDIPRSQDESRLSMHVKDSMREHSIAAIAEAWYTLTHAYKDASPELSAMVLTCMQRYIPWIDIGLVASDNFIVLLESLVGSPCPGLRGAALECLSEMLTKRMDAGPKLALIQSMRVVPVAASWVHGFPSASASTSNQGHAHAAGSDDNEELSQRCARLLAVLAGEVLEALKRVENNMISFAALGIGVTDEAAREASHAVDTAGGMLSALFPALMTAWQCGVEEVAMPLMPFMTAYVTRLKTLAKRHNGQLHSTELQHVAAILSGIVANARYPEGGACDYPGAPHSRAEAAAAADEQTEVEEKRKDLLTLFKNIAKITFPDTLSFVGSKLQAAVQRPDAAWQDVEIAVQLLYELGEGAPEEALKPDSGALGAMALALMQSSPPAAAANGSGSSSNGGGSSMPGCPVLPAARHRLVALIVLETYVRYARVLQAHAAVIPLAVAAFLDERGMGHPAEDASTRACYLFSRIARTLRQNLRPYLASILPSLAPHLVRVATTPILPTTGLNAEGLSESRPMGQSPSHAGLASNARSSGLGLSAAAAAAGAVAVDDRLYVFDAVGMLLGQDELPPEQQQAALESLMSPLLQQVEANLQAAGSSSAAAAGSHRTGQAGLFSQQGKHGMAGPAGGSGLVGSAAGAVGSAASSPVMAAALVMQSLEAISRLSKGFKPDTLTRSRPALGRMFARALEVAVCAPAAAPGHKALRARMLSFLHRMVECLSSGALQYLPAALDVLVATQTDAADLTDVLALLNQLAVRFKEALAPILTPMHAHADASNASAAAAASAAGVGSSVSQQQQQQQQQQLGQEHSLLARVVAHVHACLGPDWDWRGEVVVGGAASGSVSAAGSGSGGGGALPGAAGGVAGLVEDVRERMELLRAYYSMMHALAHAARACGACLLRLPRGALEGALLALTRGAAGHAEASTRKTCVQVLCRLLGDWCEAGEAVPGFKHFAMQQLGEEACILGLIRPVGPSGPASVLDPKDAATMSLLTELAGALKLVFEKCGEEFPSHLCGQVLPAMGCPQELCQRLACLIREGEVKELREALKGLLAMSQQAQQQQAQAQQRR